MDSCLFGTFSTTSKHFCPMAKKMRWREEEEEEEQGIDCMNEADPKEESSAFSILAQHQFPI